MLDTTKDSMNTSISLDQNYNTTKKSKDSLFFNWFNSFTNSNCKTADNSLKSNTTLSRFKGSAPNLDTNFDNLELLSIPPPLSSDDYKGVEGLTQYWNHRITFTNNLLQKQTTRANFKSDINSIYEFNKGLKSSKSIGCLVTRTKNEDNLNLENFNITLDNKTSSDKDHIKTDNFYKYKTADTNKRISLESNSSSSARNSSLLSSHEIKTNSELLNRNQILSLGLDSFPLIAATERGEKIHWAKREDIFINRKQKPSSTTNATTSSNECQHKEQNSSNNKIFNEKLLNDIKRMNSENDKAISVRDLINKNKNLFNKKLSTTNQQHQQKSPTIETNDMEIKIVSNKKNLTSTTNNCDSITNQNIPTEFNKNLNLNSCSSTDTNIDNNMTNKNKQSIKDKTDNTNDNDIKTTAIKILNKNPNENLKNSTISIVANSTESTIKKNNKNQSTTSSATPTARKYSFKTHTRNFHIPRKMTNNHFTAHHHHNHNHSVTNNKVATLTAQFNQLIQKNETLLEEMTVQFNQLIEKDETILDEIKKKNGVLLARGGHIYKLKEDISATPTSLRKRNSTKRFSSDCSSDDTSSIKSGKRKIIAKRISSTAAANSVVSNDSSNVKATVKKFESNRLLNSTDKSKIDLKNKSNNNNRKSAHEKPKVPEKSEVVLKKTKEINIKNIQVQKKIRPKSIDIQVNTKPLEDIKEESKTPLQEINEIVSTIQPPPQITPSSTASSTLDNENQKQLNLSSIPNNQSSENDSIPVEEATVENTPNYTASNEILPKKSRYARIYEKIRFKGNLFSSSSSSTKKSNPNNIKISSNNENHDYNNHDNNPGDKKLHDAIETINKKLEILSKSTNDINKIQYKENDYQKSKNNSFLFNNNSNNTNNKLKLTTFSSNSDLDSTNDQNSLSKNELIEAINTILINKTQSMDDSKFPTTTNLYKIFLENDYSKKNDGNKESKQEKSKDETYESINIHNKMDSSIQPAPQKSFLFKRFKSLNDPTNPPTIIESNNTSSNQYNRSVSDNCTLSTDPKQSEQKKSFIYSSKEYKESNLPLSLYSQPTTKLVEEIQHNDDDDFNIYQTISDINKPRISTTTIKPNKNQIDIKLDNNDDYNDENYQLVDEISITTALNQTEDGYEICETTLTPPPLPPPPLTKLNTTQSTTATKSESQRNTTDELPAIPEPKRNINLIHNNNNKINNNTIDLIPPLPLRSLKKSPTPINKNSTINLSNSNPKVDKLSNFNCTNEENNDYEDDVDDDEENIYDTIKNSESFLHCYESLHNSCNINNKQNSNNSNSKNINNNNNNEKNLSKLSSVGDNDTISIASNCYESIASIQQNNNCTTILPLMNSDSISTISSDHKTNSLYGVSMNSQNFMSSSLLNESSSSDNNDDCWIDISDDCDEDDDDYMRTTKPNKPQFIIVREKTTKGNKATEWNALVHNHRKHMEANEDNEYDSDHFYEPLCPSKIEQHQQHHQISGVNTIEHNKSARLKNQPNHNKTIAVISSNGNNEYYKYATKQQLTSQQQQQSHHNNHHHHHHLYNDDYDSFDTDDETDEDVKKNDSGVDISNKKLPDPPSTTNQVYAFVKKFKNFISNKKPITKTNENGKQYENTKFPVTPNEYQNTNFNTNEKKTKKQTPNLNKKNQNLKINQENTDPYENTEFHRPIRLKKQKSIEEIENVASPIQTTPTTPSSSLQNTIKPEHNTSTPYLDNSFNIQETSTTVVNRRKSKSDNSFKSKIRKSLQSHHPNPETKTNQNITPRSTFYISDSVDLDSGIFEKANSSSSQTLTDSNNQQQQNLIDPKSDNKQQITAAVTDNAIGPTTLGRKNKRNNKSPDLQRRKTTIGIRPNNPPPPPPTDKKHNQKRPQTSWYAECGVFKANGLSEDNDFKNQNRSERNNSTSWYAEVGLYQTSGASVASSSGSSGVSTGGENCPFDDNNSHSMFLNEPLYQIYSAEKLESISRDMEDQESTDGYEEINTQHKKPSRPSALQLVGPKCGPSRTLWSEIPEVLNSQILSTLTTQEKRLQEAKFEILTSEASYLKSLNLLRTHFMNHPAFRDANILNPSDRKTLFSYLVPVHECSDRLLCDLESCWQDNIMLIGLSRSLFKNAEKYFHVYISFCEHQGKMDRTLRRLKEQKGIFSQILENLEKDPICYGLNLHSFLMLPMQRITRLPLLIDAVFSKVKTDDNEYDSWKMTLAILNKIVLQCNEAANRCEQAYEIERISKQIEFPTNLRSFPIAPVGVLAPGTKPRYLVKRGEFIQILWRKGDDAKLTFGKKFSKINIYAFLFSDLLILTKKKSDEQFTVFDYCPRNMVTLSTGDSIPHLPIKDINQIGKNLILMALLENHEKKTVEMVISCPSVSEQQRWLQACTPPEPESPGEKLYEQWDCPQVIAKHEFIATEPDLLSLEPGDVVNVSRKMPDGWFQGERIRDGVTGWFPGNYTEEVNSVHVRARNLKQRHRLLTFTAAYLEMQKKGIKF